MKIKKKLTKEEIKNIISLVTVALAHVAILLFIILSFRYYAIYPSLFGSAVAIIVCIAIIMDLIFFVGFNHKDIILKIISTIMAVLLLIGGTFGSYYVSKVNQSVNGVLDDGSDKYETFSGLFVCYDKYNKFSSLKDLSNKKVGMLMETTDGISYIARNKLKEEKIDFEEVSFKTNAELIQGLIDNNVDAIVITSGYREIYSAERDENSPFAKYLENLIDFDSFEQELKVNNGKKAKNVNTEPFNVLLIGYSRTDIGSTVGLADSIILATINPQTYTVSMMSIARDSFVPISCYGGEYDKINSGRSTSRQCFIETVEDFIGMDIDYYMELDYLGLVAIVNTIGGIYINNPVEFELDGIYVPKGNHVFADGQMALQFCRERHHMPNGDFDRQQHQKEVIIQIAKTFIEKGDINLALDAMNAASRWMSTDMNLTQLTSLFNLLLNTKNYTGMNTFSLVDFQTLRMTGYGGIMYYSYSMRLPLWVYLIYKGSYDESMQHVNDIMGNYKSMSQSKSFEFSAQHPYSRPLFYSESYPDVYLYTPDPMPPYWESLEGRSLADALAWASANGVKLSVDYIFPGDDRYNAEMEGLVYEQSVRHGALISEYASGKILVMGASEIDESKFVPNFVGNSYKKAVEWALKYGIPYSINWDENANGKVGEVIAQTPEFLTKIEECNKLKITVKAGTYTINFDKNGHGKNTPKAITAKTGDDIELESMSDSVESGDTYIFIGWYDKPEGGQRYYNVAEITGDVTLYAHWEYECNHDYQIDPDNPSKEATCSKEGTVYYKCTKCGDTYKENTDKLPHSWSEWAANDDNTKETRECSVCGEKESRKIETQPENNNE